MRAATLGRPRRLAAATLLLHAAASCALAPLPPISVDVCVFGTTPGGVAAAVAAKRANRSLSVALVANATHVGGLTSGGHCGCDLYQDWILGGFAREFWGAVHAHYGSNNPNGGTAACRLPNATGGYCKYTHEPHVAEAIFRSMLADAGVALVNSSLGVATVATDGASPPHVTRVAFNSGLEVTARVWIDASYEGELLVACPGLRWAKGRESRAAYGEPFAGVLTASGKDIALAWQHRLFPAPPNGVDPVAGPSPPGAPPRLLPNVFPEPPAGTEGQADGAVMAFEFRPCLSDVDANKVAIDTPHGYNASRFEVLRRALAGGDVKTSVGGARYQNGKMSPGMPGPFGFQLPRGAWAYPGADAATRNRVWSEHRTYWLELFHFMRTDPSVPASVRATTASYGFCKDEHADADPPFWPPQMYVRESVRLWGDVVLTQDDVVGSRLSKPSSVGLGAWFVDLHTAERVAVRSPAPSDAAPGPSPRLSSTPPSPPLPAFTAQNVGQVDTWPRRFWVFEIPYEVLLPRRRDAANLLVPVCVSSTRVAFSAFRLESQFMIAGQASGVAAAMSLTRGGRGEVHDVSVTDLQAALQAAGAVLWRNASRA